MFGLCIIGPTKIPAKPKSMKVSPTLLAISGSGLILN